MSWRKASYSTTNGGGCVEVALGMPAAVTVRDSKDPDGPRLVFGTAEWRTFIARVKADGFELA